MEHLLAQSFSVGGSTIEGPLKGFGTPGASITIADVINRVVTSFLIPAGAVILFLVFISGAYDFLLSQGNPERVKTGKAKITAGIIGFILLILAYTFARIFSYVFGIGQGAL